MAQQKYTGFASYVATGKITETFITDYQYWCKRIYYRWRKYVLVDLDTFTETCWEALLTKLDEFNPSVASIQTFCISRINNEAWRFYMKKKTAKTEIDCDSDICKNTLECTENDYDRSIDDFILFCNKNGVEVNREEFVKDYTEGKESPPMIVYMWWRLNNNEIGGRYDISKKRRQTAD